MGENKTPDLPVQIIKTNGGPPLAVVPLPVLLALVGIARKEIERAESETEKHRIFRSAAKPFSITQADKDRAARDLRHLFVSLTKEQFEEQAATRGNLRTVNVKSHMRTTVAGEDVLDRAAYNEAKARDEEALPLAVVKRLAVGEHPVKVFRDHRRLTQAELAEAAGTTPAYLSQIETGKRGGSNKLLRALAEALEVELADLLD